MNLLSYAKKFVTEEIGIETEDDFIAAITLLNQFTSTYTWDYKNYLRSHEWSERRNIYKEYYHYTCQKCLKKSVYPLQLHHLTYARLYKELPEDLLLVCKKCHYIIECSKIV